jgi:hypothetical protein
MNNTQEIMSHALPRNTFVVQSKALEAAGISIALVTRVPAPLKSIADQVIRSASSVPANLAQAGAINKIRTNTALGNHERPLPNGACHS